MQQGMHSSLPERGQNLLDCAEPLSREGKTRVSVLQGWEQGRSWERSSAVPKLPRKTAKPKRIQKTISSDERIDPCVSASFPTLRTQHLLRAALLGCRSAWWPGR